MQGGLKMPKIKHDDVIDVSAEFVDDVDGNIETDTVDETAENTDVVDESNEEVEQKDEDNQEDAEDDATDDAEDDEDSEEDSEEEENEEEAETEEEADVKPKKAKKATTKEKTKTKTKATKKKPKVTKADIIAAFQEKEMLRMRAVNEREEQALKWHIVQDYAHTKKIARGTVISVEETTSGMVIAVVNFNDFRVVIPASEFFVKAIAVEEGVSNQARIRREKQVLVKSLGAEVEFVIAHAKQEKNTNTNEKEYVILASRKQALLRQIKYYFGKKGDVRRVEAGKIIRNVPIIAVGKEALMVTVCGIDKVLTKAQLSYKFLGTLVNTFYVGDRIDVAVLDVIEKDNDTVDIKVSHKQTQLPQFKKNISNCSIGGMYRGTITIVRDNTVQLYLDVVNVPAFSKIIKLSNVEDLPSAGDTVLLVANKIVPERGLVLGTIIRIIKK